MGGGSCSERSEDMGGEGAMVARESAPNLTDLINSQRENLKTTAELLKRFRNSPALSHPRIAPFSEDFLKILVTYRKELFPETKEVFRELIGFLEKFQFNQDEFLKCIKNGHLLSEAERLKNMGIALAAKVAELEISVQDLLPSSEPVVRLLEGDAVACRQAAETKAPQFRDASKSANDCTKTGKGVTAATGTGALLAIVAEICLEIAIATSPLGLCVIAGGAVVAVGCLVKGTLDRTKADRLEKEIAVANKDAQDANEAIVCMNQGMKPSVQTASAAFQAVNSFVDRVVEDFKKIERDSKEAGRAPDETAKALFEKMGPVANNIIDAANLYISESRSIDASLGKVISILRASQRYDTFRDTTGTSDQSVNVRRRA
mmetsp:Transcript_3321/g.5040  ORF Transcript_3321/g.5040 Transcript_3321/m.5040 type:complete len:376 (+) Transcript_3321:42-1169(+)